MGSLLTHRPLAGGFERYRLWRLENCFHGISATKFARKLLNVGSPSTLKSAEITA
jgi:hypothetical protein